MRKLLLGLGLVLLLTACGGSELETPITFEQQMTKMERTVKAIRQLGVDVDLTAKIGGPAYFGVFTGPMVSTGFELWIHARLTPEKAVQLEALLRNSEGG